MTQFLLLAVTRAILLIGFVSYLTSSIIEDRTRRLGVAALIALVTAAALDGITPDGWDYEYVFGHPFFFYIFANAPAAFVVLVGMLIFRLPANDDPFSRD